MERYNFSVRVKHYAAHNGRGCTHGCTLSLFLRLFAEAVEAFRIASPGDSLVTEVTSALGTPPKFPRSLGFKASVDGYDTDGWSVAQASNT